MKVKICGIRRREDVEFLNKYMPDFAGFVFAESRRRVSIREAAVLAGLLDKSIKKVGVFVNQDMEEIVWCITGCGLDVVQLHGDETQGYVDELKNAIEQIHGSPGGLMIWKGIRVSDRKWLEKASKYEVDAYLLDGCREGKYGGTGTPFDWSLAAAAEDLGNIILAGGLDPDNVRSAIEIVRPYAVDTSSGVETEGKKDEMKVKRFIEACRNAERR